MSATTRAVIDVGTNSVKLLIAKVEGAKVHPLFEGSDQTRLGRGFYQTHRLQQPAIEETARTVAEFVRQAGTWNPASIRIIGTSAARDATNKDELVRSLQAAAGLPLEIISGEQEADWAFQGVTSDPAFCGQELLVIDVGGGSTEFILGRDSERHFARSFPLGTVRLLEKFPPRDPPEAGDLKQCEAAVRNNLEREVAPMIRPHLAKVAGGAVQLVGTGGTTTILARMQLELRHFDRDQMEGLMLTRGQLLAHRDKLWRLSLEERKEIIGLPSKRADVILPGVVIFCNVMEVFEMATLKVSTRGLRFAAVTHID